VILKNKHPELKYLRCDRVDNFVIGDSPDNKRQQARMMKDQNVWVAINGVEYNFVVKEGFVYDMATVPGIATFIKSLSHQHINPNTTLKRQSPIHDAFYIVSGKVKKDNDFLEVYRVNSDGVRFRVEITLSRSQVDWIYYIGLLWEQEELMQSEHNVWGTPSMSEKEMASVYKALKNFGWTKWNKKVAKTIRKISIFIHKIRGFFSKN